MHKDRSEKSNGNVDIDKVDIDNTLPNIHTEKPDNGKATHKLEKPKKQPTTKTISQLQARNGSKADFRMEAQEHKKTVAQLNFHFRKGTLPASIISPIKFSSGDDLGVSRGFRETPSEQSDCDTSYVNQCWEDDGLVQTLDMAYIPSSSNSSNDAKLHHSSPKSPAANSGEESQTSNASASPSPNKCKYNYVSLQGAIWIGQNNNPRRLSSINSVNVECNIYIFNITFVYILFLYMCLLCKYVWTYMFAIISFDF